VKFNADTMEQITKSLSAKNLRSELIFNDHVTYFTNLNYTGPQLPQTVCPTQTRPLRLWILAFDAGSMLLQSRNEPAVASQQLTNLNVFLGAKSPFFESPLENSYEIYKSFQLNTVEEGDSHQMGCLINYYDFLNQYALYCFDLTRNPNSMNLAIDKVNLTVRGDRINPAVAGDIMYIVEYEKRVVIDMSLGGTLVQVSGDQ
jgi:hypothetical protein